MRERRFSDNFQLASVSSQVSFFGYCGIVFFLFCTGMVFSDQGTKANQRVRPTCPLVVTQLSTPSNAEKLPFSWQTILPRSIEQRSRLILIKPDSSTRVLTEDFFGACDPDVSFDAKRILFAGKKTATSSWQIYEVVLDNFHIRQVTRGKGDCRRPCYQGSLYTLDSPAPWLQITFVGNLAGEKTEYGSAPACSLYSCRLDGTALSRLTYSLAQDLDPCVMNDGRLVFASGNVTGGKRNMLGRMNLFGINIDGTDFNRFALDQGKRFKYMPCMTAKGLVVFVESDDPPWDGAGNLSCVSIRRPLHSFKELTKESDYLYHSPSPLSDGSILVSRRSSDGKNCHGIYRFDPVSGKQDLIFSDPSYHCVQAKGIYPRPEPDGRSSPVSDEDLYGKLYCLDVYTSDLKPARAMPAGTVKRLRVLEGIPGKIPDKKDKQPALPNPQVIRRILGEVPVQEDGSFNIEIPADIPVQLQILDEKGLALRTCAWIWTRPHEWRGCIGCHEDGELTPDNRLVKALGQSSVRLDPPMAKRQGRNFRQDVMPILRDKCLPCHGKADHPLRFPETNQQANPRQTELSLYEMFLGTKKWVQPGKARSSPLSWHVLGKNTTRPWDEAREVGNCKKMPPAEGVPLHEREIRALVEWIDLGATFEDRK